MTTSLIISKKGLGEGEKNNMNLKAGIIGILIKLALNDTNLKASIISTPIM